MCAHDMLASGLFDVMAAGGMESMTNAPYLLPKARGGYRQGHDKILDHMFLNGLEDAYDRGSLMDTFAEDAAQSYQVSRLEQDKYARASLERAVKAGKDASFAEEIAAVTVNGRKDERLISVDEQPEKAQVSVIPALTPAFREGGTATAANASSISDGAAAVTMMRQRELEKRGIAPLPTIIAIRPTHLPRDWLRQPRRAQSTGYWKALAGASKASTSGKSTWGSPSCR